MLKEGTDFGTNGEKDDFTSIEIALTVDDVVKLSFSYIFASRELPEFGGTDYNDAFFLNINGENLAKLPDGKVCLFPPRRPNPHNCFGAQSAAPHCKSSTSEGCQHSATERRLSVPLSR